MTRIRAINLIAFCTFVFFVDKNSIMEAHSLKDYLKGLRSLSQLKHLRHGILPGKYSYFALETFQLLKVKKYSYSII